MCIRDRRQGVLPGSAGRLQVADLVLDEDAHRVWRGGAEVHLTATEFTLLRCLMANAEPVSYTHLDVYKRQGSIVAFLKLSARMSSKPLMLPARHWLNLLAVVVSFGLLIAFILSPQLWICLLYTSRCV